MLKYKLPYNFDVKCVYLFKNRFKTFRLGLISNYVVYDNIKVNDVVNDINIIASQRLNCIFSDCDNIIKYININIGFDENLYVDLLDIGDISNIKFRLKRPKSKIIKDAINYKGKNKHIRKNNYSFCIYSFYYGYKLYTILYKESLLSGYQEILDVIISEVPNYINFENKLIYNVLMMLI